MKILAITQARIGSERLPGKILKEIDGKTLLEIHLTRILKSKLITKLKIATTNEVEAYKIVNVANKLGVEAYNGSTGNVLERFYYTALPEKPNYVVRLTSDCPLIDPYEIDKVISYAIKNDLDYCSNCIKPTFPDGIDVEVFKFSALETAFVNAKDDLDLEHVTPYILNNSTFKGGNLFKSDCIINLVDYSDYRITVDNIEDFHVIEKLVKSLGIDKSWKNYIDEILDNPEIKTINNKYTRGVGYEDFINNKKNIMTKGQMLYKKAKKIIPGGTMLLSKRPELHLPDFWPSYYKMAKGCEIWDLDDNKYVDMSIMGVGTNILGYCNQEVDTAVIKTVNSGNMTTLNCPEEVYLAEKLLQINPWADMVRFARTGGEANAIAIRIARAASGKDKVAVCGYHGWHDWYLAANIGGDENLSQHLIAGLEPNGVPKKLGGTLLTFNYNNYNELLEIVNNNEIGVIMMEVVRNHGPENDFLKKVRELATQKGIVLIFDECTSGFRETFGGIHKLYDVEPDIIMFGKALGNGYAITAVVGRKSVMESAQSSFISSTFWTERIGPTAALKTLEIMERIKSWEIITNMGANIKNKWVQLAALHKVEIEITGINALCGFTFKGDDALAYKTYLTQEMLSKGFLAGTSVYVSIEHTENIVSNFFEKLDPVFEIIGKFKHENIDIKKYLKGDVCMSGFKRLN